MFIFHSAAFQTALLDRLVLRYRKVHGYEIFKAIISVGDCIHARAAIGCIVYVVGCFRDSARLTATTASQTTGGIAIAEAATLTIQAEDTTTVLSGTEAVMTDTSYTDENIQITLETLYVYDTAVYIAAIQTADVSYLETALANGFYGRNIKETTSAMAESNDAIFAINGDYYGFRNDGYVIRSVFCTGILRETMKLW